MCGLLLGEPHAPPRSAQVPRYADPDQIVCEHCEFGHSCFSTIGRQHNAWHARARPTARMHITHPGNARPGGGVGCSAQPTHDYATCQVYTLCTGQLAPHPNLYCICTFVRRFARLRMHAERHVVPHDNAAGSCDCTHPCMYRMKHGSGPYSPGTHLPGAPSLEPLLPEYRSA